MNPDDADIRLHHQRQLLAWAGAGFLALAVLLGGLFWWDNAQEQAREDARHADVVARTAQLDALAEALTATRDQVSMLGDEPVAPPADVVLADPTAPIASPAPIDRELLEAAASEVVADVLPGEVSVAVSQYVNACIASGDCVGPPGEPGATGAPGRPPTPGEVASAVAAVCESEIDCTVTDDEIVAAVVAFCGQESQPCGHGWTEAEIYRIANHAVIDYLSGRGIWCPPLRDFPRDDPFGPCYVSVG